MLKIWYHRQISNFGDGISFGHQNKKFGGKRQSGKKWSKIPDFVKNYGKEAKNEVKELVVHEIGVQNLVSFSNFDDGPSFEHYNVKFGGQSQNG